MNTETSCSCNSMKSLGVSPILVDSFGDGFYAHGGDQHLTVPVEWVPVYDHNKTRPEWKPKVAPDLNIYDGDHSSSVHVRYAIHDGILVRKLVTHPGLVRMSCMAMIKSHAKSGHGVQIGIDPFGGADPWHSNVVWGDWYSTHMDTYEYGKWVELTVQAESALGVATLFLRSKNDHAHDLSAAHFDLVQVWDSEASSGVTKADLMVLKAHVAAMNTKLDVLMEGMG